MIDDKIKTLIKWQKQIRLAEVARINTPAARRNNEARRQHEEAKSLVMMLNQQTQSLTKTGRCPVAAGVGYGSKHREPQARRVVFHLYRRAY